MTFLSFLDVFLSIAPLGLFQTTRYLLAKYRIFDVILRDFTIFCTNFVQDVYEFEISDQAKRGQFVGKVVATDQDSSDSSRLSYFIPDHDSTQLQVDSSAGELCFILKYEQTDECVSDISILF